MDLPLIALLQIDCPVPNDTDQQDIKTHWKPHTSKLRKNDHRLERILTFSMAYSFHFSTVSRFNMRCFKTLFHVVQS